MPWLAATQKPGTAFGNDGHLYWFRPDADAPADFTQIPLPAGVQVMDARPSWDKYEDVFLGVGGWTENMILTAGWDFWTQGIRAPVTIATASLAGGPGVTADVIVYLAWAEYKGDKFVERSALSAPSTTLSAANQKIAIASFPTPTNPRVSHVEVWLSYDGSLPRLAATRQIGIASLTFAPSVGDLGEAFTEAFDLFPRCRFNVAWHDRQVMAGNDADPTAIYLSLIGEPERFSLLQLNTKSRQKITGLAVVHDMLLVFCGRATERVLGYTEDDLSIEIAEPQIGALNHHSIVNVQGNLWVPNHLGIHMVTGTAWFPMMKDVWSAWVDQLKDNESTYQKAWAYHDPVSQVFKLYVGNAAAEGQGFPGLVAQVPAILGGRGLNAFWVADYKPVVPQLGGEMSQPNWSYDTSYRSYDCGAAMAKPGSSRVDTFLGACDGGIYRENEADDGDDAGDDEVTGKRMLLVTGADAHGDVGGNIAHGKRWVSDDIFAEVEMSNWAWGVYAGGEKVASSSRATPQYEQSIGAAQTVDGDGNLAEPFGTFPLTLHGVTGRYRVSVFLSYIPVGVQWRGFQTAWMEGYAPRRTTLVTGGG